MNNKESSSKSRNLQETVRVSRQMMTMPLLDIELDEKPKHLIDDEKIYEFISKNVEDFEEGQPMHPYDYQRNSPCLEVFNGRIS